jgi:predicted MFS family arabinose efflux permease
MFYSNTIFKGVVKNEDTVTFLIGLVNFVASLVGLLLINKFGRKTLMVVFNTVMFLDLCAVGIFSLNDQKNAMIACLMVFIVAFEFSSGPIVWLYMSEIMCDKS